MSDFRSNCKPETPQLGFLITWPLPGAIENMGSQWDWIWICGQHGSLDYKDMVDCVRACELAGTASFVRVAYNDPGRIMRALDMGADGVIVPQVSNAEEARRAAQAAKFPPIGNRSYGGRRVIDRKGSAYYKTANTDTLLMAQIETPDAVSKADEIAAVDGIDILLIGPDDTSLTAGCDLTKPKPMDKMREWHTTVAEACKKHGKIFAGFVMNDDMIALCSELGAGMMACASDVGALTKGAQAANNRIKQALGGEAAAVQPEGGSSY